MILAGAETRSDPPSTYPLPKSITSMETNTTSHTPRFHNPNRALLLHPQKPHHLRQTPTRIPHPASHQRLLLPSRRRRFHPHPGKSPLHAAYIQENFRMHPASGFILERVVPAGGALICGDQLPAGTVVAFNPGPWRATEKYSATTSGPSDRSARRKPARTRSARWSAPCCISARGTVCVSGAISALGRFTNWYLLC